MIEVIPFHPDHLGLIHIQDAQAGANKIIRDNPDYGKTLASQGDAYTVEVDGVPMLCAGVIRLDDGRGWVWMLFASNSGRHFVRICRYVRRYLESCGLRRIEASIDCTFKEGIRLAKLMGFEIEGRMRQYGANGEDYFMMGRVQ